MVALGAGTLLASTGLVASASLAAPSNDVSANEPRQRSTAAERPAGSLDWAPCEAEDLAGLECATLEVPLNYEEPDGQTIEIAVSRLASTNPDERRGVLLTNPGGPGGSGLGLPLALVSSGMPVNVLDSYDIIGFDPRGIGRSTPVTCDWNQAEMTAQIPSHAAGPRDVVERKSVVEALSAKCADADNGGVLPYVNTANTARDMNEIRQALGEEKISYFGVSYGSYLGAVYSQLFPEQSDRIVIDSVVGPDMVWREEFRTMFELGMELRFPEFAKWVAARDATYELGDSPKQVRATFQRLAEKLDAEPIQGIDGTLFRWQVFSWTYADAQFPMNAQFMQAIDRADTDAVAKLMAEKAKRETPSASAQQLPADNYPAAQTAVLCNDVAWPESTKHYQKAVRLDSKRFPLMGSVFANMWPCASWPTGQVEEPVRIDGSVSSEVLILQNLRDPATAFPGALQMRHRMGDRSRMVTVDDGGHGVYVLNDNACANNVTTSYLVDGELPSRDRFCAENDSSAKLPFRDTPERDEAVLDFHARYGLG